MPEYTPYFIFDNFVFENGVTMTPSTEATGYDADNLKIPHPTVRWRTTSATGNTIKATFPTEKYFDTLALIQTDFTPHSNLLGETQSLDTSSNWAKSSGCTIEELTGIPYAQQQNLTDQIGPTKIFAFERTTSGVASVGFSRNLGDTSSGTIGVGICMSAWVARDYGGPSSQFRIGVDDGGSNGCYADFNLTSGALYDYTQSGSLFPYLNAGVADTVICGNYTWYHCYLVMQGTRDNFANDWYFQVLSNAYSTTVTADVSDYELLICAPMMEVFKFGPETALVDQGLPSSYPVSESAGVMLMANLTATQGDCYSPLRGNGFMHSPNGLVNCVMRMTSDVDHDGWPKYDTDAEITIWDWGAGYPYIQAGAMVVGRAWSPSGALKQFSIEPANVTSSQIGTSGGHLYRGSRTPYRKVKMQFDYNSHDDAMYFVQQCRLRGDNTPVLFWMEDESGVIRRDEWIVYGYIDYTPTVSQIIDKWRVTVQMSEVLG